MNESVLGIHHITAIAGDSQHNVNFYSGVLGLRLVKKTVNFDDPLTYHLYYGDNSGRPGTILTFSRGVPPASKDGSASASSPPRRFRFRMGPSVTGWNG